MLPTDLDLYALKTNLWEKYGKFKAKFIGILIKCKGMIYSN